MPKYFIPTPLYIDAYGYNLVVPDCVYEYYKERAEYECVGFLLFRLRPDPKGKTQLFIPGEPKNDQHRHIIRVYVITKAGYVTKNSHPNNAYIKVEEGTIFMGPSFVQLMYHGLAMAKQKATEMGGPIRRKRKRGKNNAG